MRVCTKKKHVSHAKSWISMLNSAGIHQKTASVPAYNNLYHYAGNNPVKYTDPDGRYLINNTIVFNNNGKSETAETYALSHFDEIRKTAGKPFRLGWWKNTNTKSYDLLPLHTTTSGFKNNVNFSDVETMKTLKSIADSQKKKDEIIREFVSAKVTTEKKENGVIAVNLTVSRITANYKNQIIDVTEPFTVTLAFTTEEELNKFTTRKDGLTIIANGALESANIKLNFGVEE